MYGPAICVIVFIIYVVVIVVLSIVLDVFVRLYKERIRPIHL